MRIACDFDGVICKRWGIPTKEGFGEPMEGALDSINLLMSLGHEVWVFTSNPDLNEVASWLNKYSFPQLKITSIKEPATVYIDDRGLRFTSWNDIRKYFS